jgi:hypothetical protein
MIEEEKKVKVLEIIIYTKGNESRLALIRDMLLEKINESGFEVIKDFELDNSEEIGIHTEIQQKTKEKLFEKIRNL